MWQTTVTSLLLKCCYNRPNYISKIVKCKDHPSNFCWIAHYLTLSYHIFSTVKRWRCWPYWSVGNTSSYILYLDFMGMIQILILFNNILLFFHQHFSNDATQFLFNLSTLVIVRKTLLNMLNNLFLFSTLPGKRGKNVRKIGQISLANLHKIRKVTNIRNLRLPITVNDIRSWKFI